MRDYFRFPLAHSTEDHVAWTQQISKRSRPSSFKSSAPEKRRRFMRRFRAASGLPRRMISYSAPGAAAKAISFGNCAATTYLAASGMQMERSCAKPLPKTPFESEGGPTFYSSAPNRAPKFFTARSAFLDRASLYHTVFPAEHERANPSIHPFKALTRRTSFMRILNVPKGSVLPRFFFERMLKENVDLLN